MLMAVAGILAWRGTCERGSVGAVIAREGRIISTGYVGAPSGIRHCTDGGCEVGTHGGCVRTVHAEANCIAFAAKYGIPTEGGTLYSTLSPCYECAKIILNSGIRRVVYRDEYRDAKGRELLELAGIELVRAN
jgi:dCMP deaminase